MVEEVSSLSGLVFCLILSSSVLFVLQYCNFILFFSTFPLSYWGQKSKNAKCSFHLLLKYDTQKFGKHSSWKLFLTFVTCI